MEDNLLIIGREVIRRWIIWSTTLFSLLFWFRIMRTKILTILMSGRKTSFLFFEMLQILKKKGFLLFFMNMAYKVQIAFCKPKLYLRYDLSCQKAQYRGLSTVKYYPLFLIFFLVLEYILVLLYADHVPSLYDHFLS